MYTVVSILLFLFASLQAGLVDQFKKATDKIPVSPVANVDYIYMINLDERPEKYQMSLKQLEPYGITPYRFSAVNGWQLPLEVINTLGITYQAGMARTTLGTAYPLEAKGQPVHEPMQPGKNYFSHCLSKGAIGIVLSHLSILQDAYDSGYETIWVMEDDVEVIRNPHIVSERIAQLDALVGKQRWDILFTDQDTKGQDGRYVHCRAYAWRPNFTPADPSKCLLQRRVGRDFKEIGARYGAYSMIVRRSGMEKLLNFFKTYSIWLPYDMDFTLPSQIRMFAVTEDIVSTMPRALSDNGGPNYKEKASVASLLCP